VRHIQLLESSGSAPDRRTVRQPVFQLAEKQRLKRNFNKESGLSVYN
jgi:hypothetical protein